MGQVHKDAFGDLGPGFKGIGTELTSCHPPLLGLPEMVISKSVVHIEQLCAGSVTDGREWEEHTPWVQGPALPLVS